MLETFAILILNSLAIMGLHYTLQYDEVDGEVFNQQIFWKVKWYANKYLGEYWSKPFGGCLICMSGLWSLPVYFAYYDNILMWPLYAFALAGINRILIRLI